MVNGRQRTQPMVFSILRDIGKRSQIGNEVRFILRSYYFHLSTRNSLGSSHRAQSGTTQSLLQLKVLVHLLRKKANRLFTRLLCSETSSPSQILLGFVYCSFSNHANRRAVFRPADYFREDSTASPTFLPSFFEPPSGCVGPTVLSDDLKCNSQLGGLW